MWWVTNSKAGTSALTLQRLLGLGSYQTAWAWLHKLRRAMVRPGRDRLSGEVEVDETLLGGLGGAHGQSTATKALIVVAAEVVGRGTGGFGCAGYPRWLRPHPASVCRGDDRARRHGPYRQVGAPSRG